MQAPLSFSSFKISSNFLTLSSSKALVGSSSRINSGLSIIAAAIPSFCFIPKEYVLYFFLKHDFKSPTFSITASISSFPINPFISASIFRLSYPDNDGIKPGFSIRTPTLSGNVTSFPICLPLTLASPSVGFIKPQIARSSIVFPLPFLPFIP